MDFKSAKELIEICESLGCSISEVMIERECTDSEASKEAVIARMKTALDIMKNSVHSAIENPAKSMGGLLGGETKK